MAKTTNPNTKRLATNCCVCGTPLSDSKSVELGIGPTCRKNNTFAKAYKALTSRQQKAVNKLIHEAGVVCEASYPDPDALLVICKKIEKKGFTDVAEAVRERFSLVRFAFAEGVPKYRWDWRAREEVDTNETHDVLRVWTPYSPKFNRLRRERNLRGRPVNVPKSEGKPKSFYWEFPKSASREVYKLITDVFKGRLGHGSKGYFVIGGAK